MSRVVMLLLVIGLVGGSIWWLLGTEPQHDPLGLAGEASSGAEGRESTVGLSGRGASPVALASNEDAVLTGIVRDENGQPAPGISVRVERTSGVRKSKFRSAVLAGLLQRLTSGPDRVQRVTTDANGQFHLAGLPRMGVFRVSAEPEPPRCSEYLTVDMRRFAPIELRLSKGRPMPLEITLPGDMQEAVEFLGISNYEKDRKFRTGWLLVPTNGKLLLPAVPAWGLWGTLRLRGSREQTQYWLRFDHPESFRLQFDPPQAGRVRCVVTGDTGQPVARAQVGVWTASRRRVPRIADRTRAFGVSDASGVVELGGIVPTRLADLQVEAEGYAVRRVAVSDLYVLPGETLEIPVQLARGGSLVGTVRDPDGRGLSGVRVRAISASDVIPVSRAEWRLDAPLMRYEVRTGQDGEYRLAHLPLGNVSIDLELAGWHGAGARVHIHGGDHVQTSDFEMSARPGVHGVVLDASGAPAEGAVVVPFSLDNPYRTTDEVARLDPGRHGVVTDAAGRFRLLALDAGRRLQLEARRGPDVSAPCEPILLAPGSQPAPITLQLERGASIVGHVQDAAGRPVPGRNVVLSGAFRHTTTDKEGMFRFSGLRPGPYAAVVRVSQDESLNQVEGIRLQAGEEAVVEIVVPRSGVLSGVVLYADGTPAYGVQVGADSVGRSYESLGVGKGLYVGDVGMTVRADESGAFEILCLKGGDHLYVVEVGHRKQPGTWRVPASDLRFVVPTKRKSKPVAPPMEPMRKTRVVRGTLAYADGTPVASALVKLSATQPDDLPSATGKVHQGTFELQVSGDLRIASVRFSEFQDVHGRGLYIDGQSFDGREATTALGAFQLAPIPEITGRLTGPEGEPVPGAKITTKKAPDRERDNSIEFFSSWGREDPLPETVTDRQGRFRLLGRLPSLALITASGVDGYRSTVSRPVAVGTHDLDLRIRAGGLLAGRVVGPEGEPIRGVSIKWAGPDGEPGSEASSGQDGRFRMRSLPQEGVVRLTVTPKADHARPYVSAVLEQVEVGQMNLVVRLELGHYVQGFTVGPDGEPVLGGHVDAVPVGHTTGRTPYDLIDDEPRHTFRLGPLVPGLYRVSWDAFQSEGSYRYAAGPPLEVRVPHNDRIRLTARRLDDVRGTLASRPSTPVQATWTPSEALPAAFESRRSYGSRSMPVDKLGTFHLPYLPPVKGVLYLHEKQGNQYAVLEGVRPGQTVEPLTLREGGSISGQIESPEGNASGHVWITLTNGVISRTLTARAGGTFTCNALPPGRYKMKTIPHNGAVQTFEEIEARTGEKDVVIVARRR